jgi:hypothetical protein
MAQDHIAEQVTGVVVYSNPEGFQLADCDGWPNLSRFAAGVEVHAKGQHVVAGLAKAGFVREVAVLDQPVLVSTAAEIAPGLSDYSADKQAVITRSSACLNTATAILSSSNRPTDAAAVLALAEQLERWCRR